MVRFITLLSLVLSIPLTSFAQNTTATAGYRDGFYLKTEDGKFLLKLGSRINTLYSYGNLYNADDLSSFDLKHAKFYFGGHAFSKQIQFYMQSAFAQNSRVNNFGLQSENNGFSLEDYYLRANHGDVALQLGQFKVPFSKQYMIYSGNLEFVTRSIASNAFQFGRDRGLTLSGKKPWLSYMLGLYNGSASMTLPTASILTNSQNMSNDSVGSGMQFLARLSLFPQRPTGFSEGDTQFNEVARMEWGTSFVLDQNRDYDTNGNLVVDETEVNTLSVSSDVSWKKRGLSFQGEFYYRHHNFQTIADVDSIGAYTQAGFFVVPRRLEIAARYSWLDPNIDTDADQQKEISGVLGYFLSNNHKYKMQWQYSRITNDATSSSDHWVHWMMQLTI